MTQTEQADLFRCGSWQQSQLSKDLRSFSFENTNFDTNLLTAVHAVQYCAAAVVDHTQKQFDYSEVRARAPVLLSVVLERGVSVVFSVFHFLHHATK